MNEGPFENLEAYINDIRAKSDPNLVIPYKPSMPPLYGPDAAGAQEKTLPLSDCRTDAFDQVYNRARHPTEIGMHAGGQID